MKTPTIYTLISALALSCTVLQAKEPPKVDHVVPILYGDFNNWVTREIKESGVLGGHTKDVYAVGPTTTIVGAKPYVNMGGSPWATSNVLASPMGIVKTSNAVYPDEHPGSGQCAKLATQFEHCKVIGVINMDVMVAGSMFLGEMLEPIKSTANPYSHMDMGIPFTQRPEAVQFDYKLFIPAGADRVYSSGFGKKKTYPGGDQSEVMVLLQRRWEDADGNIYAKRVGTGRERYGATTQGWVSAHRVPILYGDISKSPKFRPYMDLIAADHSYYARNSKGKMVPVHEVGWDDANATPTHIILMFSAGSGDAYLGTPGLTFWVDNVAMVY